MDKQIDRSTVKFWNRLRMKIVGMNAAGDHRTIPLESYGVESATSPFEKELFNDLSLLRDSDGLWKNLIPEGCRTRSRSALAFKLITSVECWVEAMLVDSHLAYPTKRYIALVSDDGAKEVAADPPCLFDEWTANIVNEFRDHPLQLRAPAAQAKLRFKARLEK
eukprot:9372571-Pyramimonas_sp.AAC.1